MGVKPDHWIIQMARSEKMIEPFEESLVSQACISYGVSSYGYDFRVDRHYRVFRGQPGAIIDPKVSRTSCSRNLRATAASCPPALSCSESRSSTSESLAIF